MHQTTGPGARQGAAFLAFLLFLTGVGLLPPVAGDGSPQPPSSQPPIEGATTLTPFSPNVRVTDGSSLLPHQVEPYLAVDGAGRLFVGWKEAETDDGPGARVGFARSLDGGLTWSANILMDRMDPRPDRRQSDPWLVLDERDRLYFARLEYTADLANDGVTVSRSDDAGTTWGTIVDVDDRVHFADKESMVSDGNGTIYVAYDDLNLTDERADIRITHSRDGGVTWRNTTRVANQTGNIGAPVLAARGDGTVYAAWWDAGNANIVASTSRDRGLTWSVDVRVNPIPGTASFDRRHPWELPLPSLVADREGTLFVAWPDRGQGDLDIVVARSLDGGGTWSTPVRVNDDGSGREQRMVALATGGDGVLHAAWLDNRTGQLNVHYANSTDGGGSWSPNLRVTDAETPSSYPRPGDYFGLAVDGNGTIHVVWTDGRGADLDIYFARSDLTRPTIAIRSPSDGEILTSTSVVVSGTASDNVAVARVEVSTDGTRWALAEGTSSWEAILPLAAGNNTVYARAMDLAGNAQIARITVTVEPVPSLLLVALPVAAVLAAASAVLVWRWRVKRKGGETPPD